MTSKRISQGSDMAADSQVIRVIESDIPAHWRRASISDLLKEGSLELVQDGNHGGNYPKATEFESTGIPLITGADLTAGVIDFRGCQFLNPASASRLRIGFAKPGDVLLSHKGTMGKTAIIPQLDWPYIILNPQLTLYRVRENGSINRRYLKFFFDSAPFRAFIERISGVSTISSLSLTVQKSLEIPLPPLPEQKTIARILGTLDDKIELNRRMNATLEAMARALFQSWFVDFDPVHAKVASPSGLFDEALAKLGMNASTAALFPSAFQSSALGDIPKGWRVGKISGLTEFSRSSVNPGNFPEETFDHYSLPAFDDGRQPKAEAGAEIKSNKLTVTPDAVLLSKLNPHIPRIWLPKLAETRRSVCSTEFLVARPSSESSPEYLFALFTSNRFSTAYSTLVTGTTGSHQRIKADAVQNLDTVIPPETLVAAFTAFARPLFARINHNTVESRTLATLRDTLLPKLLSGELPVATARTTVEPSA